MNKTRPVRAVDRDVITSTDSFYHGDEVTAARMKAIELPDKCAGDSCDEHPQHDLREVPRIACKACKKVKVQESFSKKELNDLRFMILRKQAPGKRDGVRPSIRGNIRCRLCTGEQVHELTCFICEETKGLGSFAKAQRRNPDAAVCHACLPRSPSILTGRDKRCLRCVNEQLDEEPELDGLVIHDNDQDSDGSNLYENKGDSEDGDESEIARGEFDSDDDGGVPTSSAVPTSGLTKQNLTNFDNVTGSHDSKVHASKGKYIGSEDEGSRADVKTNAWNKSTQGGLDDIDGNVWMGQVKSLKNGTAYTGFDSHGNPHSRYRAPSTAASFTSTAPRSNLAKTQGAKSSKFAQVRPTKPVPMFSTLASSTDETRRALPKPVEQDDEDDENFFNA